MIHLLAATILACLPLQVVDGDTVRCNGVLMRMLGSGQPNVSGIDAPEIRRPSCPEERELGEKARDRLANLLPHATVRDSGKRDRYGRPLVWLPMPDGRDAGDVLIDEGLAREWHRGYRGDWC